MELLVERCAGVDIGKDEVVACVRTPGPAGKGRQKQTRTFSSFSSSLQAMAEWFAAEGVTEVVMEATGSYWRSPWYVLEDAGFDLKLVNTRHVKILPGRKSDVLDAEWLAELLEHGLLGFCADVGLMVMRQVMEDELARRIGPKHAGLAEREGNWHGTPPAPWCSGAVC